MCRRDDFPPYDEDAATLPVTSMFRSLDPAEEASFREWAHANWQPGQYVNPMWHPVVRDECERMTTNAQVAAAERRAWDPNP